MDLFMYCFSLIESILIGTLLPVCLLPAWQGKGGTDNAACDWDKYNAPNSVWNLSAHRHRWVLCIPNPSHINNQWPLTDTNCWWSYSKCAMIIVLFIRSISVPQLTCFLLLQRFKMTMRAIQGALIISSCIQIILGYSQLWGVCSRYRRVTHSIVVSCQLMFKHLLAPIIILLFCHLRCMANWPLNWQLLWLLVLQLPYKVYF